MNASRFLSSSTADETAVAITRIEETHWQAAQGDCVVGGGDVFRRTDGRVFLSVDAWHAAVFDRLAAAMVAGLAGPLHTVVDETDDELIAAWRRAGFTAGRREGEYVVPTDPDVTGLNPDLLPPGITIVPAGEAQEGPLRALDRAVRDEIAATVGWQTMPVEVLPVEARALPAGVTVVDPATYAVATRDGEYIGFVRVAPVPRRPRIGLVAVRADQRRQGVGRALFAHALGALHRSGAGSAWAEVHEANPAALALVTRAGARRAGGNLELVRP